MGRPTLIVIVRPTWGAISREGLGQWSMTLDTCGFFTRSIDDLEILCSALNITDDIPPSLSTPFSLQGAKIGFFKSPYWPNAGPGTQKRLEYSSRDPQSPRCED